MPGSNKQKSENSSAAANGALPMVAVDRVTRTYGTITAVEKTSIRVDQGEIFGIMGSDGAGKTTLLRMIAGMLPPETGSISVDGLDIGRDRALTKDTIGYMPQRFGLYLDLTVQENVDFFMDIFGITGAERTRRQDRYLGFSNLLPFLDRKAGELSGGMKQKLGLACVLLHHPRLLILDEPTNGVDPVSRREFWEILTEMKRDGMTILVSTAYLDEGEQCDRLAFMHDGRIIDQGTPGNIRAHFPNLEAALIHRIQMVDTSLANDRFES